MAAPAHMKARRRTRRATVTVGIVGAVAVLSVAAAAVANAYSNRHQTGDKQAYTAAAPVSATPDSASGPSTAADVTPAHLVVTEITPGSGTGSVAPSSPLTVDYSEPLSSTPPLPTFNPPIAGTWTTSGAVLTFVPTGGWVPFTTETVTVPAGAKAIVDGVKTTSVGSTTTTFTVAAGDETRLEQLLAELNYLPFTFTPTSLPAGVTTGLNAEPTAADAISTSPVPGTLNWAYPNIPATLSALWTPGQYNVIDKGAIMAFESANNMTMDGLAGPQVWTALLNAVAARQATAQPYDYLIASETLPETLQVWRNGTIIYTTPANTGVPGATTQTGTFPVYLRYQTTTMTGTNVDGSKYVDPGIPWVAYFNGGDAVHGYVRASYGFPQSNGCVELPIANAAQVWPMDPYGTLVTVTA
jgi:lipoprotein-anchoring transpeptidase ErfK/SrfK